MQLNDILTSLSLGVLQNLSVGGSGSGQIPANSQSKVVNAINQGLVALYSRFRLLEKEVVVRAYDGMTIYPLKKIYADQDPAVVPQKFIADTVTDPFLEDVIKIHEIYDELGVSLPLNKSIPECVLFTPTATQLQITQPVTGNSYFLIYQAYHPKLTTDPTQEVLLPLVLHEALETFVAYKILSSMNGQEHAAKAAEHFQNFNRICAEATETDSLGVSLETDMHKLDERGFV